MVESTSDLLGDQPQQEEGGGRAISLPMNVQDAMRANLPEQVSKLLRDRLEQAEAALRENVKLKAVVEQQNKQIKTQYALDSQQAALLDLERELEERERKVEKQELHMDTLRAEVHGDANKKIADAAWSFLNALVRNPTVKESVIRSSSGYDQSGSTNDNSSVDLTRTVE